MHNNPGPHALGTRGIDVGYSNVKFTCGRGRAEGDASIATGIFPALAPQLGAGFGSLAQSASVDGCTVNVGDVKYFVGPDAAFSSNGIDVRAVTDDYPASPKYLALLRGALYGVAVDAAVPPQEEAVINNLVLGLPLNTFAKHRQNVLDIAHGEHLVEDPNGATRRITVRRAHVIVQPHGALLNFGVMNRGKMDGWTLVVDPGGGTLDWYLSSKQKTNWARSGAYSKSLLACSYTVADRIGPGLRDQAEVIGRIDRAIRERSESFRIGADTFKMSEFRQAIDAVLEECTDKMFAGVGPTADLDLILVTGGGAGVFHEYLARRRKDLRPIMKIDSDPVFSNVRGFHIYGELLQSRSGGAVA
jgi:plasmid segregation protein ParM